MLQSKFQNPLFQYSLVFTRLLLLIVFATQVIHSQNTASKKSTGSINPNEIGIPLSQNYTPKDYNMAAISFQCIFQDSDKIMYFAIESSILTFDGINWNTLQGFKDYRIKKIFESKNNTHFFTTENSFGVLEKKSVWPICKELIGMLPKELQKINKMIEGFSLNNKTYFISDKHIFIYSDNSFEIISSKTAFTNAFLIDEKIYLLQKKEGLFSLDKKDQLRSMNQEKFFSENNIISMHSDSENTITLVTKKGEFFKYKNDKIYPLFSIPKEYHINTNINNPVQNLSNGEFVISLKENGILHYDHLGNLIQILNINNGISSNRLSAMYIDYLNGVWISNEKGISRIELSSPYSTFDSKKLIWDRIYDIIRYNDELYFATNNGLFKIRKDKSSNDHLNNILRILLSDKIKVYSMAIIDEELILGTNVGIYKIENNSAIRISEEKFNTYTIRQSGITKNVYLGTDNGIRILSKGLNEKTWEISEEIYLDDSYTEHIQEDREGYIWIDNKNSGFLRIKPIPSNFNEISLDSSLVDRYSPELENKDVTNSKFFKIKNRLIFGGYEQLLEFDMYQKEFFSSSFLDDSFKDFSYSINRIYPLNDSTVLILPETMPRMILKGTYNIKRKEFSLADTLFSRLKLKSLITDFYLDKDDVIWVFGTKIYRIDQKIKDTISREFKTLVSEVIINKDSTITNLFQEQKTHQLPLSKNSIKFKLGAPTYESTDATKFKFYLDGVDDGFQEYFDYDSEVEYKNLSPGKYTFHAVAKNVHQVLGEETTFTFTILPPWYQTWWAYGLYGLLLGLFTWVMVKLRTKQIENKNKELEVIIANRTEELAQKNDRLKNLDEAKSRFFTNISHEFRTPLTLILGPLEKKIKSGIDTEDDKIMHRNAKRMQELINQLLELSKLESKEIYLKVVKADISATITTLVSSISSYAESKKIRYSYHIETTNQDTWFDRDKLEKIINNLISNAIKFTPANKSVEVTSFFDNDYLVFKVMDTGMGISEDKLPFLFERFYQIDSSDTREQEGTGIGLALVKELINIYGGTISVESKIDEGTSFTVVLPIAKHLFDQKDIWSEQQELTPSSVISYAKDPKNQSKLENDTVHFESTLLIVEDNPDLRTYIKSCITGVFKIMEAEDGQKGLDMARNHIPDIIITDIMMPKMNGEELCQKLKTDPKTNHIPIIMLTAKADQKTKIGSLKTGADAFISKPFDTEELNVRINNLISVREELKKRYQKKLIVNLDPTDTINPNDKFLQDLTVYVEKEISNPDLDVNMLLSFTNMSRTQLHRKLKALTGLSTTEFIRTLRLSKAAQLLEKNADSVTQIGYLVGFSDHSYFAKCFKKQYGKSPTEYTSSSKQ